MHIVIVPHTMKQVAGELAVVIRLGTVPNYSHIFTTSVNSIDSENMSVIYLIWPTGLELT